MRHNFTGHQINRFRIHREDTVKHLLGDIFHHLRQMGDARIIHNNINTPPRGKRRLGEGGHALALGDIGFMGKAARGLAHVLGCGTIEIGNHHLGPFGAEFAHDPCAKARCAACYNCGFSCKPHETVLFCGAAAKRGAVLSKFSV